MIEEYGFLPQSVTLENLGELSRRETVTAEARLYELCDIADAAADFAIPLLEAELSISEVAPMIAEGLIGREADPDGEGQPFFGAEALTVKDKALLSVLYLKSMSARSHPLSEADFLAPAEGRGTYGYVRNQFADEAFDVITGADPGATVRYYKTFKECAAALADGEVDHLLLPLEERGGVRLPTVADLIYRYDFRINSVTPVFGFDGDADIKYAEVCRSFRADGYSAGDDRYLELRIPAREGTAISDLLLAAGICGMSVYRISTHTVSSEGESLSYFSLVLRASGSDLTQMLTYLAIFAADAVPVGVYKNIE